MNKLWIDRKFEIFMNLEGSKWGFKWTLQSENVNPFQNIAVVCWPEKTTFWLRLRAAVCYTLRHIAIPAHFLYVLETLLSMAKWRKLAYFTVIRVNYPMRWEHSTLCRVLFGSGLEETVLKVEIDLEETEQHPWNIEEMEL